MKPRLIGYSILLSTTISIISSTHVSAAPFEIKNPFSSISLTKEKDLKKEAKEKAKKYEKIKESIKQKSIEVEEQARVAEKHAEQVKELNKEIQRLAEKVEEKKSMYVNIIKTSPTELGNRYVDGNCTWYVKSKRNDIGSFWGNANQWVSSAQREGYETSSKPKIGAIGVNFDGYYGHVVYVENIIGDNVFISEMNYTGLGVVSTRTTHSSEFQYIYAIL